MQCATDLDELLRPEGADRFFDAWFGREAYRGAGPADRFDDVLSLARLDAWLRQPGFMADGVVRMRRAEPFDQRRVRQVEEVYALLAEGWTLQVVDPHRRFGPTAPLSRIAETLSRRIGRAPSVSAVFLTPAGAAGSRRHHDRQDTFTLQLAGTKRWRLFEQLSPELLDMSSDRPDLRPTEDVEIGPGDLLYVPRGMPHQVLAGAGEGLSLSVVFGFTPLDWTALTGLLAARAAATPELAAAMPPRPWTALDDAAIQARLDALAALARSLTVADVRRMLDDERLAAPESDAPPHLAEAAAA